MSDRVCNVFLSFESGKKNPQILPIKLNYLSSTFTWYYLFFSILQKDRIFFSLTPFRGKRICQNEFSHLCYWQVQDIGASENGIFILV